MNTTRPRWNISAWITPVLVAIIFFAVDANAMIASDVDSGGPASVDAAVCTRQVTDLYLNVLGRQPGHVGQDEIAAWAKVCENSSIAPVTAAFYLSDEYAAGHAKVTECGNYVIQIYADLLGRAPAGVESGNAINQCTNNHNGMHNVAEMIIHNASLPVADPNLDVTTKKSARAAQRAASTPHKGKGRGNGHGKAASATAKARPADNYTNATQEAADEANAAAEEADQSNDPAQVNKALKHSHDVSDDNTSGSEEANPIPVDSTDEAEADVASLPSAPTTERQPELPPSPSQAFAQHTPSGPGQSGKSESGASSDESAQAQPDNLKPSEAALFIQKNILGNGASDGNTIASLYQDLINRVQNAIVDDKILLKVLDENIAQIQANLKQVEANSADAKKLQSELKKMNDQRSKVNDALSLAQQQLSNHQEAYKRLFPENSFAPAIDFKGVVRPGEDKPKTIDDAVNAGYFAFKADKGGIYNNDYIESTIQLGTRPGGDLAAGNALGQVYGRAISAIARLKRLDQIEAAIAKGAKPGDFLTELRGVAVVEDGLVQRASKQQGGPESNENEFEVNARIVSSNPSPDNIGIFITNVRLNEKNALQVELSNTVKSQGSFWDNQPKQK